MHAGGAAPDDQPQVFGIAVAEEQGETEQSESERNRAKSEERRSSEQTLSFLGAAAWHLAAGRRRRE